MMYAVNGTKKLWDDVFMRKTQLVTEKTYKDFVDELICNGFKDIEIKAVDYLPSELELYI